MQKPCFPSEVRALEKNRLAPLWLHNWRLALLALAILAALVFAHTAPHIESVDPSSGKVNDNVAVMGQNLGKATVAAVFLSDDKTDYQATIVEQVADKIVVKVPRVKPGNYNVSFQQGERTFITTVRFKVEE